MTVFLIMLGVALVIYAGFLIGKVVKSDPGSRDPNRIIIKAGKVEIQGESEPQIINLVKEHEVNCRTPGDVAPDAQLARWSDINFLLNVLLKWALSEQHPERIAHKCTLLPAEDQSKFLKLMQAQDAILYERVRKALSLGNLDMTQEASIEISSNIQDVPDIPTITMPLSDEENQLMGGRTLQDLQLELDEPAASDGEDIMAVLAKQKEKVGPLVEESLYTEDDHLIADYTRKN